MACCCDKTSRFHQDLLAGMVHVVVVVVVSTKAVDKYLRAIHKSIIRRPVFKLFQYSLQCTYGIGASTVSSYYTTQATEATLRSYSYSQLLRLLLLPSDRTMDLFSGERGSKLVCTYVRTSVAVRALYRQLQLYIASCLFIVLRKLKGYRVELSELFRLGSDMVTKPS